MAGGAILASNAIGSLFSSCGGGVDHPDKSVGSSERPVKRVRTSGGGVGVGVVARGGQLSQRPPPSNAPPQTGDWWTGSSDGAEGTPVPVSRAAADLSMTRPQGGLMPPLPGTHHSASSTAFLEGSSASMGVITSLSAVDEGAGVDGFVNHGLILWTEKRRQWARPSRGRPTRPRGQAISATATYDNLLSSNRPFPQPVPLPEMVDFLVNIWEEEGLHS
eukprot:TRINITY_DN26288_c0_g1_i1.p1 TRINITY_DN26288_c0_g1~~TRINITY_DN26288_c0_g1_i1.p1  ORF type:complete len:219 (+),score=26.22 TRINITY_DN26288_c0_g1_i1:253-909(+)